MAFVYVKHVINTPKQVDSPAVMVCLSVDVLNAPLLTRNSRGQQDCECRASIERPFIQQSTSRQDKHQFKHKQIKYRLGPGYRPKVKAQIDTFTK